MFWTFILGIAAGWAAPFAEDRIREPLEKHLGGGKPFLPADLRSISLLVCLAIACIVAMVTASGHALPLILGAICGALGPRVYDKFRAMRAPDYDT